jgi:hypothetical protein
MSLWGTFQIQIITEGTPTWLSEWGGLRLGKMAHTYNPSSSGGKDQEDRGLRPAWANSNRDPPISANKQGMVVQAYHPSY